jgi:LPS-assembly protein
MQPIYYAPKENWDIEFDPQIRTKRGFGAHLTTRFFDSNESGGRLTLGYFQNNETYAKDYNLNNKHYGLEFLYQSTDFLSESEYLDKYKSGFYVNLTHLNDLEYLNLQKNTASTLVASSLIESRMNAFIYDEEDYLGLYARYSIDTTKRDNGATLQEIPSVQYHSFMKYLWTDKLFYTFDARLHNYTRSTGSTAYQTEFDLPVTYYDTFFNDYLNLAVTENLYLSDVFFSNLETKSSNYRFYRNFHTVELSSDLSKQYGSNVHTIHPSIVYTKPSLEQEKPLKYQDLSAEQQALFITQTERENISTGVSQYYYNQDLEMNLFHRIAYTRFRDVLLEKGDINNEMGYTANNFNLYSNLFYSLDKERIHSLTTSANYNQSDYAIMLTHFYNYDLISDRPETSFLNTSLTYTYNQHNQWIAGAGYDLEQNFNHQWNIGWFHRQKCWGTQLTFGQEQIPNFDSSFRNTMAYFQVTLNPIGAISRGIEKDFAPQGQQQ